MLKRYWLILSTFGLVLFFQGCVPRYTIKIEPNQIDEFQLFMKATESFYCGSGAYKNHILKDDIFAVYAMNPNTILPLLGRPPEHAILLKWGRNGAMDMYFMVYPDGSFVLTGKNQLSMVLDETLMTFGGTCYNKKEKVFEPISKEEVKVLLNRK